MFHLSANRNETYSMGSSKIKPLTARQRASLWHNAFEKFIPARIASSIRESVAAFDCNYFSAQCTDKRVNMVTPALFKNIPTRGVRQGKPLRSKAKFARPDPSFSKSISSTTFAVFAHTGRAHNSSSIRNISRVLCNNAWHRQDTFGFCSKKTVERISLSNVAGLAWRTPRVGIFLEERGRNHVTRLSVHCALKIVATKLQRIPEIELAMRAG